MLITKVIGTTVSTVKDGRLTGRKLMIVRPTDEAGAPAGKPVVAVDTVDAGVGALGLARSAAAARPADLHQGRSGGAV
ncbi:ethanolamine utilization protein EutN, partial [bacterium]|nr:ethanolamine utilization protein EutN [bacterium]